MAKKFNKIDDKHFEEVDTAPQQKVVHDLDNLNELKVFHEEELAKINEILSEINKIK